MIYFDATLVAKLYLNEPGSPLIVKLVRERSEPIVSSILGEMESRATFHRKLREREISFGEFRLFCRQFDQDIDAENITFLPLKEAVVERVDRAFHDLPSNIFLRTGDAIHLATAAEAGFKEIYSNDRHLLAAASLFKLKAINPLAR
jgi:predicted nucleic acid-binding protein